jgi:hypothetical protein
MAAVRTSFSKRLIYQSPNASDVLAADVETATRKVGFEKAINRFRLLRLQVLNILDGIPASQLADEVAGLLEQRH